MKKIITLFGIILAVTLFSCKDVADVENQKLGIKTGSEGNIIAVPSVDGTSYINIFRTYEETDGDGVKTPYYENIGQIVPLSQNENFSYIFTDELCETGKKYKYLARYNVNGTYTKSSWSDEVVNTAVGLTELSPFVDSTSFMTVDTTGYITLNKSDDSVSDGSLVQISKDNYYLTLGISNGTIASTFKLTASNAACKSISEGFTLALTSVLNTSYFNKTLKLLGVVGEKVQYYYDNEFHNATSTDEKKPTQYKIVNWTKTSKIILMRYKNDLPEISEDGEFVIPLNESTTGDYDFTDSGVRALSAEGDSSAEADFSDL